MQGLLKLSSLIDGLNERVGRGMIWLVLIVVVISAGNAVFRFAFNMSSNALLEIQWYLFSAIFLLSAGYVLKRNEHIRIDVLFGRYSERTQNWIDVFGFIAFLLPMGILVGYLSWFVFTLAWTSGEMSSNAGGLIRWPVRLMMPVGFVLLVLQGLSELVKRLAFLQGIARNPLIKEAAPSAEQELAEAIKKHQVAPEVVSYVEANHEMVEDQAKQGERK